MNEKWYARRRPGRVIASYRVRSVKGLVGTRTNKLVWRGWAEGSVDGVIDNQEWMEARIDDAVAQILQRLPRRL